jgi:hypothetical protein
MTSAKYRIYVRLKNGDQWVAVKSTKVRRQLPAPSLKCRSYGAARSKRGLPASGTELEVPLLRGGTVKARIGSSNTEERGGFAGTLVTEIIYADEI